MSLFVLFAVIVLICSTKLSSKFKRNAELEKKKKSRADGVLYEDYTLLTGRIEKMETAIGSIVNKVDSVLTKLENVEKAKKTRPKDKEDDGDQTNNYSVRQLTSVGLSLQSNC